MKRGHWLLLAALLVVAWQAWQRHPHVGATSVAIPNDVGATSVAIPNAVRATSVATPDVATKQIAAEAAPTEPAPTEAAPTQAAPTQAGSFGSYPREVAQTLALIQGGGPFPYDRDGVTFGNFEHHLPDRPRGFYHEYTVPTPGAHNRGARRIITGGRPPSEYWYTGDHYDSFSRLDPGAMR